MFYNPWNSNSQDWRFKGLDSETYGCAPSPLGGEGWDEGDKIGFDSLPFPLTPTFNVGDLRGKLKKEGYNESQKMNVQSQFSIGKRRMKVKREPQNIEYRTAEPQK